MSLRLLLVEDDQVVSRSLEEALTDEGFDVHVAPSAETALGSLTEVRPEVVLTDVRMPGLDGVELLKLLRERAPSVDVVLMTAYEDMETVVRAMREGAFEFLVKPLDLAELRSVLERVAEDRRTREHEGGAVSDPAEAHRLDSLVGHTPQMIDLYKRVGQLAANRVNVLIRGETGTGKGRLARAIHYSSAAASEPFIHVNCTALPGSLLESELFGHVRGAFTGAVSDRRGRFALAGRGTIFLDEVGDTTPEFQAKLLRVLEQGEFYPVGAEQPERTDARVLAATHRPLEELVERGLFREDLYYRLRVMELRVPPLRERTDDLPLLAEHFAAQASERLQQERPALPDQTIRALLQHDWPGNVRELENCLARAVVVATGGVIRPEHLALTGADVTGGFMTLDEIEARHLRRALTATGGNRTQAAELLGVSKPRLYRMMERHEVS